MDMSLSLVEKYTPKRISDIVNQAESIASIINFLENFEKKKKKALLLYGPTGCGKTSTLYAIANEFNYEIIQLTSEDFRGKEVVNLVIKNAISTTSLFGRKKMILIDELESFVASDKGGLSSLLDIIASSKVPIILITLDFWDSKILPIKPYCEAIEFKKLVPKSMVSKMKKILESENIEYDDLVLEYIAKNSGGDMRAALNDLDILCTNRKRISKEDIVFLEERAQEINIFTAVQKIFKTSNPIESMETLDAVNIDIDTAILWLAENIPNEYVSKIDRALAYNYISRSDVFIGRISRRQNWELLSWAINLATTGVTFAKNKVNRDFVRYSRPSIIAKLSESKKARQILKSISFKISTQTHTSTKIVAETYVPLFRVIFNHNEELSLKFKDLLSLEKEEVSFLSQKIFN